MVDKSARTAKIWKDLSDKPAMQRGDRVVKDKSKPGVGDYDTYSPWKYQQPNREYSTAREKKVAFTDVIAKQKKYVPSPNLYKVDIAAYKKLSVSPTIKAKRH